MLQEQVYTLEKASSVSVRREQYKSFLRDVLSAEINLIEDGNYFWLDENKNCGFYACVGTNDTNSESAIQIAYAYGEPQIQYAHSTNKFYAAAPEYLFYHVSKDKSVIYLREKGWQSTSNFTDNYAKYNYYVAAKDEKNNWHIFSGNYILGSEGQINSQNSALTDTKSPFIASKAITPDGAKFAELNRLLFATSFEISSTLVAFNGVPHRVVSVDGTNPCFTFPVSED